MGSVDAAAAMEKIRAAGLLRTQGLIGGKWVDAYDGKTLEVTTLHSLHLTVLVLPRSLWAGAVTSRGIRGAPRFRVAWDGWELGYWCRILSSFCWTEILPVYVLVVCA
jgi:hypothetical protein